MRHRSTPAAGFTLIELLVVLAIISILAALLVPGIIKARCHANEGVALAMIKDVTAALKARQTDVGSFPATQPGFVTSGPSGLVQVLGTPSGPGGFPYYEFNQNAVDPSTGEFIGPLNRPFYYSNATNPMGHLQRKTYSFDLWMADCDTPVGAMPEAISGQTRVSNWR